MEEIVLIFLCYVIKNLIIKTLKAGRATTIGFLNGKTGRVLRGLGSTVSEHKNFAQNQSEIQTIKKSSIRNLTQTRHVSTRNRLEPEILNPELEVKEN